ncbi:ALOX5 [Bugula neritina]|uniref:ALOX5 n=1 Tax=Bugula neritina TaxID=10212 RepID=A0A7J7J835_BUGNE|nr:ALOX5 [Bugula neritina]
MNHTKWPTTKEPLDEDYIVKSLPPKRQALDIIFILKVLSERGTNSLGDYTWRYAYGPLLEPALNEFRAELADVAATVDAKISGERDLMTIFTSEIPNSISI